MKQSINMRIRACRRRLNLTQEQMASALGMKRSTYAHMESGGTPSLRIAILLSKIFGVSVRYLLEGGELRDEIENSQEPSLPSGYNFNGIQSSPSYPILRMAEPSMPYRRGDSEEEKLHKELDEVQDMIEQELLADPDFTKIPRQEQDLLIRFRQLEENDKKKVFHLLEKLLRKTRPGIDN